MFQQVLNICSRCANICRCFEHLFSTHNSVLPRSSQAVHTSVGNTIIAEVLLHSTKQQQSDELFPTSEIEVV